MDNNKIGQTASMNADPEMAPTEKPTPPPQENDPVQPPGPDAKPAGTSLGATVAKGEILNGKLYVTLKGKSPGALQTLEAKTLAYNERYTHGVGTAGIEAVGPPWPCNAAGEAYAPGRDKTVDHYRALYKLTAG
jgi:hypothetical protein